MTVESISWSISMKECCRPEGIEPATSWSPVGRASYRATEAGTTFSKLNRWGLDFSLHYCLIFFFFMMKCTHYHTVCFYSKPWFAVSFVFSLKLKHGFKTVGNMSREQKPRFFYDYLLLLKRFKNWEYDFKIFGKIIQNHCQDRFGIHKHPGNKEGDVVMSQIRGKAQSAWRGWLQKNKMARPTKMACSEPTEGQCFNCF